MKHASVLKAAGPKKRNTLRKDWASLSVTLPKIDGGSNLVHYASTRSSKPTNCPSLCSFMHNTASQGTKAQKKSEYPSILRFTAMTSAEAQAGPGATGTLLVVPCGGVISAAKDEQIWYQFQRQALKHFNGKRFVNSAIRQAYTANGKKITCTKELVAYSCSANQPKLIIPITDQPIFFDQTKKVEKEDGTLTPQVPGGIRPTRRVFRTNYNTTKDRTHEQHPWRAQKIHGRTVLLQLSLFSS